MQSWFVLVEYFCLPGSFENAFHRVLERGSPKYFLGDGSSKSWKAFKPPAVGSAQLARLPEPAFSEVEREAPCPKRW